MQKSLIALAVLSTVAATASAQSSVTLYGRVDAGLAKKLGSYGSSTKTQVGVEDLQSSRLGVRGVEDLGGGLKAIFNLEHGLKTDTGGVADSARFWNRRAVVGLEGGFGRVVLGREQSPAYTLVEGPASPWGIYTVAGYAKIIKGGRSTQIDPQRFDNSITYSLSMSGFTGSLQWAAKEETGTSNKNPFGFALSYAAGPFYAGLGYVNPKDADDSWTTLFGSYDFGMVKLGAFFGTGRDAADGKTQSWLLSATAPLGSGQLRVGYGQLKEDIDTTAAENKETTVRQFGIGYHYALSKRTWLYVDVANDSKAQESKTGYDIGIRHDF